MRKNIRIIIVFLIYQTQFAFAQSANDYLLQGNIFYNAKKYEEALATYQKITENKTFKNTELASANYNLGNAYAKLQKWQEAVDSYTKSLMHKPNDVNAKYNLCYAKRKLEQQQQKDKKQKDPKENQKDKQENQKDKQEQQKKKEQPKDKPKEEQQNQQQQPKTQPSKLTKQQAEQYLKALKEEEKKILSQKRKGKEGGAKMGKDW